MNVDTHKVEIESHIASLKKISSPLVKISHVESPSRQMTNFKKLSREFSLSLSCLWNESGNLSLTLLLCQSFEET